MTPDYGDQTITEEQLRQNASTQGYGEVEPKTYASGIDGPLHFHPFAVTLLVVEGEFALQMEDRRDTYRVGESCNLAAHVIHAERAGADGAMVLLAKKFAD